MAGDGGDGGDIILRADVHVDQLASLFFKPLLRAKNGGSGSSRQKHGKSAPDVIIPVPVGTLVYRVPAPGIPLLLKISRKPVISDVNEHEENNVISEEAAPVVRKKLGSP